MYDVNITNKNSTVNQIPGTVRMAAGWNPAKFDLLNPDSGVQRQVIHISYERGKTKELNGVVYDVPDQFEFLEDPAVTCYAGAFALQNAFNFSESFSANFASSESSIFGLVTMSDTATMKQLFDLESIEYGALAFAGCGAKTVKAITNSIVDLKPSYELIQEVQAYVCEYPKYENNIENWWKIIDDFGAAHLRKAEFGGSAVAGFSVNSQYFSTQTNLYLAQEAQVSLEYFWSANGGTSINPHEADASFISNTNSFFAFLGGTPSSFSSWFSSLWADPGLIKVEFASIAPLINKVNCNGTTLEADSAINNYTMIHFLTDFVSPQLSIYSQGLTNWNISENCSTVPSICESDYTLHNRGNYPSCCSTSYTQPFPSAPTLQNSSTKISSLISSIQAEISLVSSIKVISELDFYGIIAQATIVSGYWAQGQKQAQCYVTYNQGGCPSYASSQENRVDQANNMCGLQSPNNECCTGSEWGPARHEWCCSEQTDGTWLCPLICNELSGIVESATATWPTALLP